LIPWGNSSLVCGIVRVLMKGRASVGIIARLNASTMQRSGKRALGKGLSAP
jgi:hypothetical protein